VEAATAAGIVVTHTPSYCVDELADHAMALLLAVSRRITRYDRRVRAGHWDYKDGLPLHRLAGSTLGLVGFGQVAQAVARRARGFDLEVIAADPHVGDEVFTREHVERVALPALLSRANMVSIHAALTSETRHLIGARELARLRPGAIVVNTARGAVCDQAALTAAVESGRLAGAGLDVLEREPPDAGDPLLRLEDVVLTPHAGFLSIESLAELQAQAADDVRRVLSGERPRFGVNTDAASARRAGRTPAGARA
jgi:D-3-phosphoglycerate dehydrogenase